jgi:peptidoglycan/xylan/chitin deacetylase (PgdA/CDA1 family)
MALIIRIDVDRPYGRQPFHRHLLSRIASDLYLPRLEFIGYLRELELFLDILREHDAKAHIFFRRCTLPTASLVRRMRTEGHVLGLHLENSRCFESFEAERRLLECHLGQPVLAFSKHGSGGHRYGWHHHAPYEPENYIAWADRSGMRVFLGNLEDPTLPSRADVKSLVVFPSAFWLEPDWRDTKAFPVGWLVAEAVRRDVVLLVHPENVLASPVLVKDLKHLLAAVPARLLPTNENAHA